MTGNLIWQHPERAWWVALVVVIAAILAWRSSRTARLGGWRRWISLLCKVVALLLLALCLLDPLLTREVPRKGANELAMVMDDSASMTLKDSGETRSRAELANAAMDGAAWLKALETDFKVRGFAVADSLTAAADFAKLKHEAQATNLVRAVQSLRETGRHGALAAVVLFTDGNATDAARWKSDAKGAAVFPVVIGNKAPKEDLALTTVVAAQSPFEESPVTVTTRVRGLGLEGRTAVVCAINEAGERVAMEKVSFNQATDERMVRLEIRGAKSGVSFYRIVAVDASLSEKVADGSWRAVPTQEATLVNNERLVSVDRGAGPYRILYVAGRPNWEYKFMRRALSVDPEIQVPALIRIAKREPKFEWRGRSGETSNPLFRGFGSQNPDEALRYDQPVLVKLELMDKDELSEGFPKSPERLFGRYRAIIIDDLEAEFFTQEQMRLIERFVSERGGALLTLGGQESYRAGGYEHTPVGRMLPVYLDRGVSLDAVKDGRFDLTREGWLEAWTRLRPKQEDDEARMVTMPGFYTVNQVTSIKPGASVLATVSDAAQHAHPALVVQRFGAGKVGSVMIGDLWRWGMHDPESHADLDKAWRQLTRWLVADVPDRVEVACVPRENESAGAMNVQVRVRDEGFRPMEDTLVKLVVTGPDKKEQTLFAEPSLAEAGLFEAAVYSRQPGAYRVVATVEKAATKGQAAATDLKLAEKGSGWSFDAQWQEWQSLEANRELMGRMANDTGGRVLNLDEVGQLPDLLKMIEVPMHDLLSEPLWHAPWFMVLVLGLLLAEWSLRRKAGGI